MSEYSMTFEEAKSAVCGASNGGGLSPVRKATENLGVSIKKLAEVHAKLEERLEPVLSPDRTDSAGSGEQVHKSQSPLAEEILAAGYNVNSFVAKLNALADRLEI